MNSSTIHPYLDALCAMHDLLDAVGEDNWHSWISKDIDEWKNHRSTQHHLSAYGGMGSFNDIVLEDVWLGPLFDDLKSCCYYLAHHIVDKLDTSALEQSMGNLGFELPGWRCFSCGCGVVSRRDIDYYIARPIIRQRILAAAEQTRLRELVTSIVSSPPIDEKLTAGKVATCIEESGLSIREGYDWFRPCSSCGSNHTAVYRWLRSDEKVQRFVPAPGNLPFPD